MAPTIYPSDHADAKVLARRLLDAAGPDRRDEVQTITDGPLGLAFDVSDEVYGAVFPDEAGPPAPGRGSGAGAEHRSVVVDGGESSASPPDREPADEDALDAEAATNADTSENGGSATSAPRARRRAR